jgi:hypothetical protein
MYIPRGEFVHVSQKVGATGLAGGDGFGLPPRSSGPAARAALCGSSSEYRQRPSTAARAVQTQAGFNAPGESWRGIDWQQQIGKNGRSGEATEIGTESCVNTDGRNARRTRIRRLGTTQTHTIANEQDEGTCDVDEPERRQVAQKSFGNILADQRGDNLCR